MWNMKALPLVAFELIPMFKFFSDIDLEVWPTLTLAISQIPQEVGLSYFTCVFLITSPFNMVLYFYLVTLTLKFDLLLKILTLAIIFEAEEIGL